ncbi:MAG: TolC family protein, partial [Betaproteobacteria bacterium]|nr:TolC family protein [Betaproteobacteria bacterium]
MARRALALAMTGAALVAACSLEPPYERPALELPQAWKETAPAYATDGRWWKIYGDAALDQLVDEALANNADLAIATARVDQARGFAAEIESGYFPSVTASGSAARQQVSTKTATFPPGNVIPSRFNDYRAALNVSYEIDFFGRIRSSVRAARA